MVNLGWCKEKEDPCDLILQGQAKNTIRKSLSSFSVAFLLLKQKMSWTYISILKQSEEEKKDSLLK